MPKAEANYRRKTSPLPRSDTYQIDRRLYFIPVFSKTVHTSSHDRDKSDFSVVHSRVFSKFAEVKVKVLLEVGGLSCPGLDLQTTVSGKCPCSPEDEQEKQGQVKKDFLSPAERTYYAVLWRESVSEWLKIEELGLGRSQPPTSQLTSFLVPRQTYMRRYPQETYLFPLTKPSQFGYNIQTSTIHTFWPILQKLNGASAVCQDPDTVLIRVESMIENTTLDFRSKDGTVVRIPVANFNIIPRSVTKYTTPCSTRIRMTTICVNNQGK
ncbi:hypothetical protein TNCV_3494611 [Trichonephila clavipes]|nr:hypothetical protein TNCV_3494611 [Trichonephila clavipes]